MPMYAYECKENGHHFEVRQSFDDDPVAECPECGSPVRRLIQPAGIVFKGSGFYVTDNKKAKSSTATPSSSTDKSSNGSKSDSSSDSKSESKSASKSTEKASSAASTSATSTSATSSAAD